MRVNLMQEIAMDSCAKYGTCDNTCTDEFLVFKLAGKQYGIRVQQVQEFRSYDSITEIADAPDYIKNIVARCNVLVPVIDPRIKFNLSMPKYDMFTTVVGLNIGSRVIGMVADSV